MKLLVLSDIHGNFDALQSVYDKEKYDKMLFLGDAVDYGPEPDKVLDFLKTNSDFNILGNHDNAVLTGSSCNCSFDMLELSDYTRENISMKLLGKNDLALLKTFKLNIDTEIDGKNFIWYMRRHTTTLTDTFLQMKLKRFSGTSHFSIVMILY
jgi:Predicted phosphoesterase